MLPQPTSDAASGKERVDPGLAATQLLKEGVLAFKAGDKSRARELIAQAAELAPHNELVWMWTASAARNRSEALGALDRALAINPDNAKAQQWVAKLRPKQKTTPAPSTEPAAESEAVAKKPVALAAAATAAAESRSAPQPEPAPQEETSEQAEDRVETQQPAQAEQPVQADQPAQIEEPAQTEEPPQAQEEQSAPPVEGIEAQDEQQESEPESEPEPRSEAQEVVEQDQESQPIAEEAAVIESVQDSAAAILPKPIQEPSAQPVEDDPLRALLREKAGEPADPIAEAAPEAQASEETSEAAHESGLAVTDAEPETELKAAVEESEESSAPEEAAGAARPISTETCLLCGKRSLTDGACSYCKAVADISQLDEISRNENADRTVMLTAIERFRKELDAGPSFEANLGLALAYLNMKQSNDALPRLAEACRLQPDKMELQQYYEQLRARRLILVVDDSKTVQKMIAGVLEKELYRVSLAEDGLQALARLDDETPSLILLDITMPRMDGYQVARIITGNDATASIPVVMLSGKDGFFDRMRGKLAGARGYVTKPFDPAELTDTIKRHLDG